MDGVGGGGHAGVNGYLDGLACLHDETMKILGISLHRKLGYLTAIVALTDQSSRGRTIWIW